jgi:eukaryotic-like serine/threonine-protein kinase
MKSDRWSRLRLLLDRALELSDQERHAWLEHLPEDARDLREDLDRLLAQYRALGPQTAPNAMDLAAPMAADDVRADSELDQARVGQHIGPYRLEKLLGTGGMGAVYLAERLEDGFAQSVALKVVRTTLASQVARDRFERERQILAGLRHEGIALLFDGGQTPEGHSFYTMEHVDGETISDYCTRRDEPTTGRVRLLLQVATILAYAHQNLVVHRDIKPSNVLVTREGRVKLIDFGLAKLLDEHLLPTMTQTGLGPMTPVYAAPEQFEGRATTVGTDIYQFGVLAFLVLTGCLPYRADPEDSLRWARAVLEEEPTTLARASRLGSPAPRHSKTRRKDLSADLDAIVRKCLAKSPDDRYRSVDALIGDIEAFLAGRPVGARSAGVAYFAWRFVQRNRYAVAATALASLAIVVIGIAALRESRTAAEHAARAAREAEIRRVTRAMLTDLLRVGPASAAAGHPKSALEVLDQGTETTLRALASNVQHRIIAAGVLAQSYLDLDHPQRARDLLEQTLSALGETQALDPDVLQLKLLLARTTAELGDVASSSRLLGEAEATVEAMNAPRDSPTRLAAALARVQLERHDGRQEQAREMAARVISESDHAPLNETLEFASLLTSHATQNGNDSAAIGEFTRAWKIIAAHYGADSPAALSAERYVILRDLNGPHRLDTGALLSQQEERTRAAFGEHSLDYADVLMARCEMYQVEKAFPEADVCLRKVLAIQEAAPDAEALLANLYDNIAANLLKLQRPDQALPFYERELVQRLRSYAPTNQNVIHSRLQIAKTRCLLGDIDQAYTEFSAAIIDYVASVGPLHPYEAVYAAYFATCLLDAGRIVPARMVMENHGRLDPARPDITDEDRADVQKVWDRLAKIP